MSKKCAINRAGKLSGTLLLLLVANLVLSQSQYPGQHLEKLTIQDKLVPAVYAFDLKDVKLLDSRFRQNMEREQAWILSIGANRLLHSFRTNAGVYSGLEGGYDAGLKLAGWESLDCELRGHSTGHILSGLALLYAATNDSKYKLTADSIVNGLAEVQKALNQNGYLSAFPQELINRNIAGQRVWAPWYTLHKLYAGLIDQYLYCDNKLALDIVSKMGEWAYQKLQPLSEAQRALMLRNEFGGMNDAMYNLYAITGNEHFKWVAAFFYHNEVLDPLKQQKDVLSPKHANTYIPKLIGLTRNYELEGGGNGDSIASFFWQTVMDHHSFATGSNSDKEHFFTPDKISEHLTGYTGESCNVYNMLKLTRHLFTHTGDVKYADYYEKALYNHILGQQDPATGMVSYFLPMKPGAHKVYSTPDSSFWCCVGSGFENQAKYGEGIYYHNDDALFVNLFIPSQLNWSEKKLTLKQETAFPENGSTTLVMEETGNDPLTLNIRYPSWAVNGVVVSVNGKRLKQKASPGSYISIKRNWKKNDRVEINFPVQLHMVAANDDPSVAAIAYGPIVLAGEMGTENFQGRQPYSDPTVHNDYYTYDYHIPAGIDTAITIDKSHLNEYIKPVSDAPLRFKLTREGITLRPLYDIHRQRYVVYWKLK